MSRITMLERDQVGSEPLKLLESAEVQSAAMPELFKVFANSPAALKAFVGLRVIVDEGSLAPQTRARVALAMAQRNACEYCISACTLSGRMVGLTGDEMASNREGFSEDAKASVAVRLALSLAERRGDVETAELVEARDAGYTDADIVEIITHAGLNLLANMMCVASGIRFGASTPAAVGARRVRHREVRAASSGEGGQEPDVDFKDPQ